MTIASKTRLLGFQFLRAGIPFIEVSTRADLDASESQRAGAPFFGVGNTETLTNPSSTFYARFGSPFNEVTANSAIDASFGTGRLRVGQPFVVKFSGTSAFPSVAFNIRVGAPYREVVAKPSINASEFDFSENGAPFWVKYEGGVPPPSFDASKFFLIF